ncbi:MAG: C-terminal binding protein, partial [Nitrospinota bacterium]
MSEKKYKVVLTDYVWDTLDVEQEALREVDAELVPMQTKKTEEFLDAVRDADAVLNTYAGPILGEHMR